MIESGRAADDGQVVRGVVDGRGPDPAQPEPGGDRDQVGPAAPASGPGSPRRPRGCRRAARPGCSSRTAGRPLPAASTAPRPGRTPSAPGTGPGRGAARSPRPGAGTPPAGMRRPARRPTAASFGPPVSTTRPASIRPWLVSTVAVDAGPVASPRNATSLGDLDSAAQQRHGVGGHVTGRRDVPVLGAEGAAERLSRRQRRVGLRPPQPGSSQRTGTPRAVCMAIRSRAAATSASVKQGSR